MNHNHTLYLIRFMLSQVGQNTGIVFTRTVTLQHPGCLYEAIIMHELLHTLGNHILYFRGQDEGHGDFCSMSHSKSAIYWYTKVESTHQSQ